MPWLNSLLAAENVTGCGFGLGCSCSSGSGFSCYCSFLLLLLLLAVVVVVIVVVVVSETASYLFSCDGEARSLELRIEANFCCKCILAFVAHG